MQSYSVILTTFLFLLLSACGGESDEESAGNRVESVPQGMLPDWAEPRHYRLDISINPEQERFSGRVEIDLRLKQASDYLWLHSQRHTIHAAYILHAQDKIEASLTEMHPTGVAKVQFKHALSPGDYRLIIEYDAPFDTSLEGLHRMQSDGRWYAFTQFEATSGRLAFPSFDEPRFKVSFDTVLRVKQEHVAVSNTPIAKEEMLDNGMKKITFQVTKPLPTYLIAFAVGELDVVEWQPISKTANRDRELPLRGIATKGKGKKLTYILQHTEEILNSLENYFGTAYPYAKLDLLAVPDFAAGAMENAGAITYREEILLIDETSSLNEKRRYASIHAHELAHQWFGNLVTPKWWDDIWLNEAFATWMSYRTLMPIMPEQHFDRALQSSAIRAMDNDSLKHARQIREPILSNHDIANAFDGITYSKGGGVLSMFEHYVGEQEFRAGIRHYMQKHRFGTTTAEDFIQAIAEKAPADKRATLRDAFFSFLEQPGVPLVKLSLNCSEDKVEIAMAQERYLEIGSAADKDKQWRIPVCMRILGEESEARSCTLLDALQAQISLPQSVCPQAVMPNAEGAGYYRWSIPADAWKQLLAQLPRLSVKEQIAVVDSFSASVNAGTISIAEYLQAIERIAQADAWEVAVKPMRTIAFVLDYMLPQNLQAQASAYFSRLYAPRLAALGLHPDTPMDRAQPVEANRFRSALVGFSAKTVKDPDIRKALTVMAENYLSAVEKNNEIPASVNIDLIQVALDVAADELGMPFQQRLHQIFRSTSDLVVRRRALEALARTLDEDMAKQVLALVPSKDVRDNEVPTILENQARLERIEALWQWVQPNHDVIVERFPTWRKGGLPGYFADFCNDTKAQAVETFFKERVEHLEGGPRILAQTVESIRLCAALVDGQADEARRFFAARKN